MQALQDELKRELLCGLARENCVTMLKAGAILEPEVIARVCKFVSTLCRGYGDPACDSQSETCGSAAQALENGDEKKFLELCQTACTTCPYMSRISKQTNIPLQ